MEAIGAYDAKTHLPRLLEEVVSAGKSFVITRHGQPVARLGPVRKEAERPADVIAALRKFRHDLVLGDGTIRELIDEGRR